jgi:hypothetical protein
MKAVTSDFDHVDRDEDYKPTIPEMYNKYIVTLYKSTPLSNAPTMKKFRDELATDIFKDGTSMLLCTSMYVMCWTILFFDDIHA